MNTTNYTKPFLIALMGLTMTIPITSAKANFDGPYAGGTVGYSSSTIDAEYDFSPLALGTFSGDENLNGLEFGIFGGYRHQFDNRFVLGGEIGGILSTADGDQDNVFGGTMSLDKNNEFYISAKPGYAIKDDVLVYGIVGYQRANYELSWSDGTDSTSGDDTFDGFHFGFGGEYQIKDKLTIRAEYKHQDYGDESYTTAGVGTETYGGDEDVIRIGVAYNF